MKTEEEIKEHMNNLKLKLSDAFENAESDYDADGLQTAIAELEWVLK
jgi:hypothetical protein